MRLHTTFLFGLAALVCFSPSGFAGDAQKGQADFAQYCAPCHGTSGKGDGPVAPELTKKPIDLTALARNNDGKFDFDQIKKKIDGRKMPRAHGTSQMPVWGQWFSYQATAGGLLQEDRQTIEKQVTERLDNLVTYLAGKQEP